MKKFKEVRKFGSNLSRFANKSKVAITAGAVALISNSAMAAVTVDPSTGAVSGTLETSIYFGAAAVILTALAGIIVMRWVIGLMKRA